MCCTLPSRTSSSVANLYPIKQAAIEQALSDDKTTHYMYEFNDSIREIAKRYDCIVADFSSTINYYNVANETVDGSTHPNLSIHKKFATIIRQALITQEI